MERDKGYARYIGDGVYASYDGYHIWVKTNRDGMEHSIALETEVFNDLIKYREDLISQLFAEIKKEK
jgi:hypothetical protein